MISTDKRFSGSRYGNGQGLYCLTVPFLREKNVYKIGRASNLNNRMRQYRGYFSRIAPVTIICFIPVQATKQNEDLLINAFQEYRETNWESDRLSEWITNIDEGEIINIFKATFPNNETICELSTIDHSERNQTNYDADFDVLNEKKNELIIFSQNNHTLFNRGIFQVYTFKKEDLKGTKGYERWMKRKSSALEKKAQEKNK